MKLKFNSPSVISAKGKIWNFAFLHFKPVNFPFPYILSPNAPSLPMSSRLPLTHTGV